MEVGKVYDLFPTFGRFCEYARIAPHVLPHDFAGSMEGYYQVLNMYTFVLTSKIANPGLPYSRAMFSVHNALLKYVYPLYGGTIVCFTGEIYPTLPLQAREAMQTDEAINAYKELPGKYNELINYLSDAADKLNSFFSGYSLSTPTRKKLCEIPAPGTLSQRANDYFAKSTYQPLQEIPSIVNPIVSSVKLSLSLGPSYPRLKKL